MTKNIFGLVMFIESALLIARPIYKHYDYLGIAIVISGGITLLILISVLFYKPQYSVIAFSLSWLIFIGAAFALPLLHIDYCCSVCWFAFCGFTLLCIEMGAPIAYFFRYRARVVCLKEAAGMIEKYENAWNCLSVDEDSKQGHSR